MQQAGRHVAVDVALFEIEAESVVEAAAQTAGQVPLAGAQAVIGPFAFVAVIQIQGAAVGVEVLRPQTPRRAEVAVGDLGHELEPFAETPGAADPVAGVLLARPARLEGLLEEAVGRPARQRVVA